MRAAVLHQPGEALRIEHIDVADIAPLEVRIAVRASGLCHSDYSYAVGNRSCQLPMLLGHEVSGTITAIGAAVSGLELGDRVIASVPACGDCHECHSGHPQRCDDRPSRTAPPRLSLRGEPVFQFVEVGGFAEEVIVDHRGVVPIPDDMPLDLAALLGCAVISGFGAVERCAKVRSGQSFAVIGCGGVGLNIIQAARIAGASRIIAIDPVATKRELARRLGATDALPSGPDVAAIVEEMTGGGVDYAFEAVGRADTIASSVAMLRKGGAAVLVGIPRANTEVSLPMDLVFRKELRLLSTISGSMSLRDAMPKFASYYRSGQLLLEPLIDRRIRLEDINDGFAALHQGEAARILIDFQTGRPAEQERAEASAR